MITSFGSLADGRDVHAITLGSPDVLQAQVLTYGGILRELTFLRRPLVASLPNLDAYVRDTAFVGAVIGRVANRIAGARFTLNGREHQLTANEGANHLHGGRLGFGKRLWRIVEHDGMNRLRLALHSPAGEEGYPGNLDVEVEYVVSGSELSVRFEARADEDTLFSPTFHPYFNTSEQRRLLIQADSYLRNLFGETAAVAGTSFDFRTPQPPTKDFDHCWVLNPTRDFDAELADPETGITLTIRSDRPGIQFYGGQHSPELHAICLEPEGLPNTANVPAFPSIVLKRGAKFDATFRYSLRCRGWSPTAHSSR